MEWVTSGKRGVLFFREVGLGKMKTLEGVGLYKMRKKILGSFEKNVKSGHQVPYKLGYFFITLGQLGFSATSKTLPQKNFLGNFLPPLYKRHPRHPLHPRHQCNARQPLIIAR
jgi:hypothetical protein